MQMTAHIYHVFLERKYRKYFHHILPICTLMYVGMRFIRYSTTYLRFLAGK